ncbi:MAG: 4Fe-4S dicluster domain-containing protein [Smithella sp.]|nr:4Fe-4S dicluster domain-containing protein [Smithella sp.]
MNSKNTPEISRRSFLRISAGAAALTGIHLPKAVRAESAGALATLIDLSLCDGCTDRNMPACVQACRSINANKISPVAERIPEPWPRKTIEDWSKKQDVTNRLTPYNYLFVHRAEITVNGERQTLFVPRRCMHCDNPACATICPFSANHKNKNGAVVIDPDQCFGGAKCRDVCPWEIPQRQSGVGIYLHILPDFMGNGVMYKCDLCNDRLKEGKMPGCIEVCPRNAMLIGPRKEIEAEAQARAGKINGHIYGQKENGGTATLYVSPVSFELLNQTMTGKPGQPAMKPGVERRMAGTDPLGKAVLASPVLGLALAGAAGWFSRRGDRKACQEEDHD